jgi:tripartite-type tricarboxylate transporter receptor subunit TctC
MCDLRDPMPGKPAGHQILACLSALLTLCLLLTSAMAQTFPSGTIRIIVPYAAGGLADALARVTGQRVQDAVGHPVIVDNRPGASSIIGMQACASAAPDGHTVCLRSRTASPTIRRSLPGCLTTPRRASPPS